MSDIGPSRGPTLGPSPGDEPRYGRSLIAQCYERMHQGFSPEWRAAQLVGLFNCLDSVGRTIGRLDQDEQPETAYANLADEQTGKE